MLYFTLDCEVIELWPIKENNSDYVCSICVNVTDIIMQNGINAFDYDNEDEMNEMSLLMSCMLSGKEYTARDADAEMEKLIERLNKLQK